MVSTSPEIQAEFAQNDAWIAPYASDYAYTLKKAGLNVKFVQGAEGTPASFITANLVAGRNNVELASKFIGKELSPEAQACFSDALRYTPTNAKTVAVEGGCGGRRLRRRRNQGPDALRSPRDRGQALRLDRGLRQDDQPLTGNGPPRAFEAWGGTFTRLHAMTDRRETWLLLSPGLALLVLAFLLPIARMLVLSVQGPDGYHVRSFRPVLPGCVLSPGPVADGPSFRDHHR